MQILTEPELAALDSVVDETGWSICSRQGGGLEGVSSRSAPVRYLHDWRSVQARSVPCQALDALNLKYQAVPGERPYLLGKAECTYPEAVTGRDSEEVLRIFCCENRAMPERALLAHRVRGRAAARYTSEYAAVRALRTPVRDIPLDCDPARFYQEEESVLNGRCLAGRMQERLVEAVPEKKLGLWRRLFLSHKNKDKEKGPGPDDAFALCVEYSRIAVWERETGRAFCGSMDPPGRTVTLYFTEAQLESAIRYAREHGCAGSYSEPEWACIFLSAGGRCRLCGRPVSECGPLSVINLFTDCKLAWLPEAGAGPEDYRFHLPQAVAACRECAVLWPVEFRRLLHDEAGTSLWDKCLQGIDAGCACPERDECIQEALGTAQRFCEKAVRQPVPDCLSWDIDLDAWLAYSGSSYLYDEDRRHGGHSGEKDALSGLEGILLKGGDLAAVRDARHYDSPEGALKVLAGHFGPDVRPLPSALCVSVIKSHQDDMSELERWRHLFYHERDNSPQAQLADGYLEQYAAGHGAEIQEAVNAAASNRRLAARYAKAVRMALDGHADPDVLDKGLLDIPWRCFYFIILEYKNGKREAFGWSLERMAQEAGAEGLPGGYKKAEVTKDARV